jgi:hypothetical protein
MVPQMPRSSLDQSKHAERNLLGWCITNYNIRCSSQPTGNPSGNRACIPARSGEESLCVLIRNLDSPEEQDRLSCCKKELIS